MIGPLATADGGYRLPMGLRLGRVLLQVASLPRSLAYYRDVLGLQVSKATDRQAVLGARGDVTPLVELRELAGAAPVPAEGRLGLYHFALLLPDRQALGRFLVHLADRGVQPGASDHLVSEALYLRDPDGLGIEVYADRPRHTWRHEGDELAMASDPLDLDGLVRAAAGEPWTGAPAGTAIGHIHLHVADLTAADALYHRALGFERTVWSYPGALFLAAGGYHHHLGLNTWARSARPAGEHDARLLEWEIVLPTADDVERAVASLTTAGYPVQRAPTGGRVRDPWGTSLLMRSVEAG